MSSAKSRTSMERTSKAETAIGDLNAEVEQLMMTMSQVVHGTAPAATGGGRRGGESRGTGGTPFQAPDSEGLIGGRTPKDSKCSVWGGKSHFIRQQHREEPGIIHGGRLTSAHGEPLAYREDPINISSQTPRLRVELRWNVPRR